MSQDLSSVEQHEQAQVEQEVPNEDQNQEQSPGLTRQASSYIQIADVKQENDCKFDAESAKNLTWIGDVSCGPYSFGDCRDPIDAQSPPPMYFNNDILLKTLPTQREEILKGLTQHQTGGLLVTDQDLIQKQSGVLSNVAKQLAVNMLKGLSISHISLPIRIFEPRSSIQRIVDFWSHCSEHFKKAAECTDPVERMKWVITSQIASFYVCTGQNKPFNPLLGETNQGSFSDGSRYYCEHTSHHPPISHYLLEGANNSFRMSGYYEFIGKMSGNAFVSGLRGPCTLEFPDGTVIRFNAPDFKISGALMGERILESAGSVVFQDIKNKLKAVIVLSTFKESGFWNKTQTGSKSGIEGLIYQVKTKDNVPVKFGKSQDLPNEIKKINDISNKLCDISGGWLDSISFGAEKYWSILDDVPARQIPQTVQQPIYNGKDVLPTDWRYREDLIWLMYGYMEIAANWKLKLEVQQRKDRKNRQDAEKRRLKAQQ